MLLEQLQNAFRRLIILVLLCFTANISTAQESINYETLNRDDFSMKRCPIDTAAPAMILNDIGSTVFMYDMNNGFYMVFKREIRIMIFKKEGYKYADWSIPLYRGRKSKEVLENFKARTYNQEGGKIIETKLKNESIFEEEEDSYQKNIRFTFPAVREGSILELKYTIRSPFFGFLRDWVFQKPIPVRWSEYSVMIPEYYEYATMFFGNVPFYIKKASTQKNSISDNSGIYRPVFYTDNTLHLAVRDVPALKIEPYVNSMDNYTSRVEFTLRSYKFPNSNMVDVNATWRQITSNLLKDEDFGIPLQNKKTVELLAAPILEQASTPEQKMEQGFYKVQNLIKWNGRYSKYTSKIPDKTLSEKTGNSADINLILVMLMRRLGLDADPVLLSTRDHGVVKESNPSQSSLNHVICLVTIDKKEYLLDATNRWLPYTFLPFQCLNGKGLVASEDTIRWVSLLANERNQEFYDADLKLTADGAIEGEMKIFKTGYLGRNVRQTYFGSGKEEFCKEFREGMRPWEISDVVLEGLDTLHLPARVKFRMQSTDIAQVAGDLIYVNVFANFGQSHYDFSKEKRSLPIDFGCPFKETYSFTWEIPEGYRVESFPEKIRIVLPDKAGSYQFMISVEGNIIKINAYLAINKANFGPDEYLDLDAFTTQAMAKQAQQIVLKKI